MSESTPDPSQRSLARRLLRMLRKLVVYVLLVGATIYLVRAFDSRRGPDLELWHTISLQAEMRARDVDEQTSFADYLAAEDLLFEELDREVYAKMAPAPELQLSRYNAGGPVDPRGFERNWNRTFELEQESPRGAALLVHGLTDSPYSLRRVAEILHAEGYHVLGLRLPGHGTIPASLAETSWKDWRAVLRLAAHYLTERVGEGVPFVLVGYSAGGALVTHYAAEAILVGATPRPDHLVLFSPAIGITPFAKLSGWHRALSFMPFFEKFRWKSMEPEYDPFKYNSFPKNAGEQMERLAVATQKRIAALVRAGRMQEFPTVLAFQSLVDSTVLTSAVTECLFDVLEPEGRGESELVLFDINGVASLRPFVSSLQRSHLDDLEGMQARPYRLTVIANVDEESLAVVARSFAPGSSTPESTPLGLAWPGGVYSLSHVAMPFRPDDPIYGRGIDEKDGGKDDGEEGEGQARAGVRLSLGSIQPRGERGLLRVSINQLMRLRYNPFFDFVEARLLEMTD